MSEIHDINFELLVIIPYFIYASSKSELAKNQLQPI